MALPVGYGMYMFWAAVVVGIAGSVFAMRPIPKVTPVRQRADRTGLRAHHLHPNRPVLALLQEDTPAFAAMQAPSGPGGSLAVRRAARHGQRATCRCSTSAPQLRALAEADQPRRDERLPPVHPHRCRCGARADPPARRSRRRRHPHARSGSRHRSRHARPPRRALPSGQALGMPPPPPPMRSKPPSLAPPLPESRATAQRSSTAGTIAARLKA
ncbi:MAG: hypothetical protein IPQ07_45720 [Myxococcales bacterium]|nr:hypothetical protein [Myxococcales bacterium]